MNSWTPDIVEILIKLFAILGFSFAVVEVVFYVRNFIFFHVLDRRRRKH